MRLIDADAMKADIVKQAALIKIIFFADNDTMNKINEILYSGFMAEVDKQPTVDVPDIKVGKWIYYPKASGSVKSTAVHLYPVCSECGYEHPVTNYCPNCGARMGEEDGKVH